MTTRSQERALDRARAIDLREALRLHELVRAFLSDPSHWMKGAELELNQCGYGDDAPTTAVRCCVRGAVSEFASRGGFVNYGPHGGGWSLSALGVGDYRFFPLPYATADSHLGVYLAPAVPLLIAALHETGAWWLAELSPIAFCVETDSIALLALLNDANMMDHAGIMSWLERARDLLTRQLAAKN